jgi:hypothetical protein
MQRISLSLANPQCNTSLDIEGVFFVVTVKEEGLELIYID